MLAAIGARARRWAANEPWTNVYGLGRSILAAATLVTLVLNPSKVLFQVTVDRLEPPMCAGLSGYGLFCLFPREQLELARWIGVIILIVVASGWRPRLTGVAHWWVSFSLAFSMSIPDGGDQITAVLTLLLLPVTVSDPRSWHWSKRDVSYLSPKEEISGLIALSAMVIVRIQVAGIYLHSSVAKLGVEEWADGTALYYWLVHPSFGAPHWIREPLIGLLRQGWGVASLTWGSILLEFALFLALVLPKPYWKWLLRGGIAFHAGIAILMGLGSFSLTMMGALVLFVRPWEEPFKIQMPSRGTIFSTQTKKAESIVMSRRLVGDVKNRLRAPAGRR